ncbi:MAG TPA: arsenic-transporting ATPase, partial [Thermoplasmata archaeon]|nr:arsenic-transporting ATPase [Thermoplasmata archaeon]
MSKLILFGGKGGTGKTTFASSAAIWVAQHGFRTLVISSDPAHSTSDSFEMKIGSEPTPIKGVDNLYGLEIDPAKELEDKLPSIKETLESPFKTLGFGELKVDASDLMLPGLDEALSFDALLHYLENPEFDVIIFDTAPTGHTLRFLSLPSLLDGWLMKILKMKKRINAVKNLFRSEKDDTIDEIIKLRRRIEHIIRIITDPKLTSFYIVLIPEKLAVEETKRAIKILQSYSIPIHGLLINNLFPKDEKCEFCKLRRQVQIQYIKEIEEYVKKNKLEVRLAFQEMLSEEVKGIETLRKIGENIFKKQFPLSLTKTFTMRKDGKA